MQCRGRQPHGGVRRDAVRGDDAGGYVLVGVVCFAAAVVVTVFCTRLRKNNKQQEQTKEDEET